MIGANDVYSVAHRFNPECLTIAREFRGYRKSELASRINVTPSAVTQFESGLAKPNVETLARISMALGFPIPFFGNDASWRSIPTDRCHFRSLKSTAQKHRRRLIAAGSVMERVIAYVEGFVEMPVEQLSGSQQTLSTHTLDEIEEIAGTVRRDWGLGLGPIPNIVQLLESKGVFVMQLLDDCREVDAFSFWESGRPYIFLSTEKGVASRNRFNAVHELGHLLLHGDVCLPGDRTQEKEAHAFAAAFLLPADTFGRECPRRLVWPHFLELKRRWRVSLAAMLHRAHDLHLLSDATYRRASVQLAQKGWRFSEPDEPPLETPELLANALLLLEGDGHSERSIADRLGLAETTLRELVSGEAA
jgi:Zn-dependent peptidase ImmA (M78 family)/transcriptional regulator with XRE-family HTH domain